MAGPTPAGNVKLFNEAHSFVHHAAAELDLLKQAVLADNEQRMLEVQEARRTLEQEKAERREQVQKLRQDFEDFVGRKVERVVEEMEQLKKEEIRQGEQHQKQIQFVVQDMELLRDDLCAIQATWDRLVASCAPRGPGDGRGA